MLRTTKPLTLALAALAAITLTTAAVAVDVGPPMQKPDGEAKPLVELFTSNYCPACPYAESVLDEIQGIERLAYHVTMWDYGRHKDKFATRAWSSRQRDYMLNRRSTKTFTPEAIINGKASAEANRFADFNGAVDVAKLNQSPVLYKFSRHKRDISIKVSNQWPLHITKPKLRAAWTSSDKKQSVKWGDERKNLTNHHVVLKMETLCDIPVEAGSKTCATSTSWRNKPKGASRLVVFVQDDVTMEILGAHSLDLKKRR